MGEPPQIPLQLVHPPEYGRDSFVVGQSNYAALALIERWPDWPQNVVVLSGPPGSGKTHLARIWASRSKAPLVSAGEMDRLDHAALLRSGSAVVEDLDQAPGSEQALFHLINASREQGGCLLLTSRSPVGAWPVELPDLRSRLRLATPAQLTAPDDVLLRQVVVKLFADRQLTIDKGVLDFLLPRMERSLAAAQALVAELDREALARGRAITRPIATAVLARQAGSLDEFTDCE